MATKHLLIEDKFFPFVKSRRHRVAVDVQLQSFVNFGIMCSSVVNFRPTSLYPRVKNPRWPMNMRLGGPRANAIIF